MKKAYAHTIRLIISRVKAYGQKWYHWYSRTRGIRAEKVKQIAKKHQKKKLITTKPDARFTINPTLLNEYENVKTDT